MKEEKPTSFERITIEFNLLYNELLATIRDRDTKAAQEKFLKLYEIYRKISNEKLTKEQKKALEKQLRDISVLIPSERPPQVIKPMLLFVALLAIILVFKPGMTGLAVQAQQTFSANPEISAAEVSAFELELNGVPVSLAVSGSVTSFHDTTVRIYLVDGNDYYLAAEKRVNNGKVSIEDMCIETCNMDSISSRKPKLLVEAHNSIVKINKIKYTISNG